MGRSDLETLTRDEALAHADAIVSATSLPVSGDFENGFGDAPDVLEETIKLSAEIELAGISIEDISPVDAQPYSFDLSVERIRAASAAARALPKDFVLVARADGFMYGAYDIDEAIRRIQAFEAAGADCVYIPYLKDIETVAKVCSSVSIPVKFGSAQWKMSAWRTLQMQEQRQFHWEWQWQPPHIQPCTTCQLPCSNTEILRGWATICLTKP